MWDLNYKNWNWPDSEDVALCLADKDTSTSDHASDLHAKIGKSSLPPQVNFCQSKPLFSKHKFEAK